MVEILRMRLRSGGHTLIGRRAGNALNQLDAVHRHAELFGDELRLRRVESVPDLAFAGERGYRSVGRDRNQPSSSFDGLPTSVANNCAIPKVTRVRRG